MPIQSGARRKFYRDEASDTGEENRFTDPHSPWQLMVEKHRIDKKLSFRALAKDSGFASGTLFNWLRSREGAPKPSFYTRKKNASLAKALGIPAEKLLNAWKESRTMLSKGIENPQPVVKEPQAAYPSQESRHRAPRPAPEQSDQADNALRLIEILEATGMDKFDIETIKRIHKSISK